MLKFKKLAGVAVIVAVAAALGLSSIASAQTATPPSTGTTQQQQVQPNGPRPMMLHSKVELDAAAKALGMTSDELSAQLWGGKTLADIATAKGVDIATVQKAVQAAVVADIKANLAQAVKDGKLTQAKADWLTQGLDNGYWGPNATQDGFGFGAGPMGGPGGRDGGPRGGGPNGGPMGRPNGGPNGFQPNVVPNGSTPNSNAAPTTPSITN